jgi:hypothetical protein
LSSASGQDLTLSTGGSAGVTLDSTGNVGIGTASPGYELDVVGDINFSGNLYQGDSLFASPWTESSGNVYRSRGNVGIGLTNPSYKLDVAGTGRVSTTLSVGQDLTIDTAGDLNFAATHRQMINLRVGAGGFGIGTQTDTTYFRSPGNFAFYEDGTHSTTDLDANGGTARLVIRSGGKVGIGRTDPSYDLDVVGDINFSGNLYKGGSLFPSPSPWTESGSNVYRSSGNVGIGLTNPSYKLDVNGAARVSGALSKGSGSFTIDHPLPEMKDTHNLYHSFIEGPRADLIYRGKVRLQNGRAMIDIDAASNMTTGTFEALNRDVQSFTSNESDWDPVRGSVVGNVLTIECQNPTSTALISWLVIGERHDQHMYDTDWTDENGRVVPEQLKKSATT